MRKCNFGAITIKAVDDNEQMIDVRKDLGNALYMQGKDIVECELGHTIWHSQGEVELNDEQEAAVKRFISGYPYLIKNAIEKAIG